MKKILVVSGGLLLVLGGAVVVVVLFFTFAGFSEESGYFGYAALTSTMAAADSEAEMQEESLAAAEAPAAEVAQPRVASSAPRAAVAAPLPNASFASDARVIRNGILTLVVQDPPQQYTTSSKSSPVYLGRSLPPARCARPVTHSPPP